MGDMQAMAYGEAVYEGSIQLEVALSAHFASNHYPPLPQVLVPIAIEAIDHANAGEWDDRLDLPAGITWKGQDTAPVAACIEAWHLEWFLDQGAEF